VALVENPKNPVASRLERRHDERAASLAQFWKQGTMPEKMLDFYSYIETDLRMTLVESSYDTASVAGHVQEVGIGEADVTRSCSNKVVDIFEHDFGGDGSDAAVVDDRDGTMPAPM
jgi:hypothetical protein